MDEVEVSPTIDGERVPAADVAELLEWSPTAGSLPGDGDTD